MFGIVEKCYRKCKMDKMEKVIYPTVHRAKKIHQKPHKSVEEDSIVTKKQLWKENARLVKEKEEIISKFNELEDLSVKKVTKLREKIQLLQREKCELTAQNADLNSKLENLIVECEENEKQLELYKVCGSCEKYKATLENLNYENSKLIQSSNELSEDLSMLKTVVFRLNVQLERYQEKLRKNGTPTSDSSVTKRHFYHKIPEESDSDHKHTHAPMSWGRVNSNTLLPLLEAFQDTLNEKDELIAEYEQSLSDFTGKYKEILHENEEFHKKLTEDDQCSLKLKIELCKLKDDLEKVKEQNDGLIKKCALKQDKLEEVLKIYEVKVEQLKRDYNVLHDQYYKSRNEIASLNEKNKNLLGNIDEIKNEKKDCIPLSVHSASVNECKKWYEELKVQYEKEKEKLKSNIDEQSKTISELKDKMSQIQMEKQGREEKIRMLEKNLRKIEGKNLELEHTLNSLRVSKTELKKQLHKAMSFAKDLVAEQETLLKALSQRSKENKAVTKISEDMANRMDNLKSQLKEVQKGAFHELSTVEGKIHQQEETIEQMKEEYEQEINRLEKIIKKQELAKIQSNLPISPYVLYKEKIGDE